MLKKPELIKDLEEKLGIRIRQLNIDEIAAKFKTIYESTNTGYALDGKGNIIGLNLHMVYLGKMVSFLKDFSHLQRLSLSWTLIDDISPLLHLQHLTHLDLSCNEICNISGLGKNTGYLGAPKYAAFDSFES